MSKAKVKPLAQTDRKADDLGKLSYDDYHSKYDLTDPDTYKSQGNQLAKVEQLLTLQASIVELSGCTNWVEYSRWMHTAHQEGGYFRAYVTNQIKQNDRD